MIRIALIAMVSLLLLSMSRAEETTPATQQSTQPVHPQPLMEQKPEVPLDLPVEEILKIKKKAIETRRAVDTETIPSGVIRSIYTDVKSINEIRTSVNYLTVLVLPEKIQDSDIVIGSQRFIINLYDNRYILIYPTAPFKATNMTVFMNNKPLHFLLKEEAQASHCDYRVDVFLNNESTLTTAEMLKVLIDEIVPDTSRYRGAGATVSKPTCTSEACRKVVRVMEVKYPRYVKGFKIKIADNETIKPKGELQYAVHQGFLYVFYPSPKGHILINDRDYEIF